MTEGKGSPEPLVGLRERFRSAVKSHVAGWSFDGADLWDLEPFLLGQVTLENVAVEVERYRDLDLLALPSGVRTLGERLQLASSRGYSFGVARLEPGAVTESRLTEVADELVMLVAIEAPSNELDSDSAVDSHLAVRQGAADERPIRMGEVAWLRAGSRWTIRNAGRASLLAYIRAPESLGAARPDPDAEGGNTEYTAAVKRRLLWCDIGCRLDSEAAVRLLARMTTDTEPIVRWTAARALLSVDRDVAVQRLVAMRTDNDEKIRRMAKAALAQIPEFAERGVRV